MGGDSEPHRFQTLQSRINHSDSRRKHSALCGATCWTGGHGRPNRPQDVHQPLCPPGLVATATRAHHQRLTQFLHINGHQIDSDSWQHDHVTRTGGSAPKSKGDTKKQERGGGAKIGCNIYNLSEFTRGSGDTRTSCCHFRRSKKVSDVGRTVGRCSIVDRKYFFPDVSRFLSDV